MTVYIVLLIALFLGEIMFYPSMGERNKRIYAWYAFALVGGLSMLRKYTVGMDLWGHYYKSFKIISNIKWRELFYYKTRYEKGFVLFFRVLASITKNPQFMIAVYSIIVIGFFCYFFYKYSENITMAIVLFIAFNHWFTVLSMMRQMLAVCIGMIGIEFLIAKNKGAWRFIVTVLCFLLAMQMHYSAIILFVFIPIYFMRFRVKELIASLVVFLALLLSTTFVDNINDLIQIVVNQNSTLRAQYYSILSKDISDFGQNVQLVSLYGIVTSIGTLALGILALKNKKVMISVGNKILVDVAHDEPEKNTESSLLSDDFLIYSVLILSMLRLLTVRIDLIHRFSHYFFPFMYILLTRAISRIQSDSKRKLIKALIYGVCIVAFVMINASYLNLKMYHTVPYEFFWQ